MIIKITTTPHGITTITDTKGNKLAFAGHDIRLALKIFNHSFNIKK